MSFKNRLRDEIEYRGLRIKEVAEKALLSPSTFLSYVDAREVMPSADVAVKIARVLGVSVEYLVIGADSSETNKTDSFDIRKYRDLLRELEKLSPEMFDTIKPLLLGMIQSAQKTDSQKKTLVKTG